MITEALEAWKNWVNPHKEPDGTIDLYKHPEMIAWMTDFMKTNYPENQEVINGLKSTSEFKVKEKPVDV